MANDTLKIGSLTLTVGTPPANQPSIKPCRGCKQRPARPGSIYGYCAHCEEYGAPEWPWTCRAQCVPSR